MDNLPDIYREVSKYDLHYSTVRTSVSIFLVSVSFSLGSFLLKEGPKEAGLIFPTILFLLAIGLSTHYQRLTKSCRTIQRDLENRITSARTSGTLSTAPLVNFRERLAQEYRLTKFFHWDIANSALVFLTLLYLLAGFYVLFFKSSS